MPSTIPGGEYLSGILDTVAQSLLFPIMVILVIFIIFAVIEIGSTLAEYTSRKNVTTKDKNDLMEKIAVAEDADHICDIIDNSILAKSDKRVLTTIARFDTETYDKETREVLARNVLVGEEDKIESSLQLVDIVAKVGSGCGLLGTIIPMGPGLAALSTGDMVTLTTNLTVAFNTTTAGLASGTVCYVIAKVRRNWYNQDLNMLYDIAEVILEVI